MAAWWFSAMIIRIDLSFIILFLGWVAQPPTRFTRWANIPGLISLLVTLWKKKISLPQWNCESRPFHMSQPFVCWADGLNLWMVGRSAHDKQLPPGGHSFCFIAWLSLIMWWGTPAQNLEVAVDVRLFVHGTPSFAAAWLNGRSSGQWPTTDRPASCAKAPTFEHLDFLIGIASKGLCSLHSHLFLVSGMFVAPEYMGMIT